MYQSFAYLETRILLSPVESVFIVNEKTGSVSVDKTVLQKVFMLVRALGCSVLKTSCVEHLTGNLPENPQNKKITGYSLLVSEGGTLDIIFHSRPKTIHIEEIRIEEDAGHLTHADNITRMNFTWAGCPSIRIKTSPSFELGEEAELFLNELRCLNQYLNLENKEAQEGAIRSNAFVALSKYPELPDYYVKLRNLNSANFVRKAINVELSRQEEILISGGIIESESRLWNEKLSRTELFHTKRNTEIRRFEQLVPPQKINVLKMFNEEPQQKTELPKERRERFRVQYGLSRLRSEFLCDEKARADYFEKAVEYGANPLYAAHWMASELVKLLKSRGTSLEETKLTAEKFAEIIKQFAEKQIHSGIAKQLMQAVAETGESPSILLRKKAMNQISDEKEILPFVKKVIEENPGMCERLRHGEMAPIEFLTGLVMKKTGGLATPQKVKQLIKKELKISIVYVLNMGGAMTAVRRDDGSISSGDPRVLKQMLQETDPDIPVQIMPVGQLLSEEMEPADWAELVHAVSERIEAGLANGIVITHGTDTLSYTAAFLFWLFSDAGVPIVITSSSTLFSESDETKKNLSFSVRLACEKKDGVYVVYNGKIYSPLNLRFDRPDSNGFRNLTTSDPVFTGSGPVAQQFASVQEPDANVMAEILKEASSKMVFCRVYPGFRSDTYQRLLTESVRAVFLELYENGTLNMRRSDYSLKNMLVRGRQQGVHFYCTSQQETMLNFSQYVTGKRAWREGAVPMGRLSTESAIALYFACSLVADSDDELNQLMESYAELYGSDAM